MHTIRSEQQSAETRQAWYDANLARAAERAGRRGADRQRRRPVADWLAGVATLLALLAAGSAPAQPSPLPAAPTNPPILSVAAYDPGVLGPDGNWHGIAAASDGNVYLGLCTHDLNQSAMMLRFDPRACRFTILGDLGEVTGTPVGPGGHVPQGKVHTPFFESRGRLYFATHVAVTALSATQTRKPYPGGCFIEYDMGSGRFRILGRAPEGEGLITLAADFQRHRLYALTYPSALFMICDLTTNGAQNLGTAGGKWETPADQPKTTHTCRYLAVDPETGRVFGSRMDGTVFVYDPARPRIEDAPVSLAAALVGPADDATRAQLAWRTIRYDEATRTFFGTLHGTASLFQFDSRAMTVTPLVRMVTTPYRDLAKPGFMARLAFGISRDRVLYHLTAGPALTLPDAPAIPSQSHLVSYDLKSNHLRDHGALLTADKRRVLDSDSLALAEDGTLWAITAVEVVPPGTSAIQRMLVRISPSP